MKRQRVKRRTRQHRCVVCGVRVSAAIRCALCGVFFCARHEHWPCPTCPLVVARAGRLI